MKKLRKIICGLMLTAVFLFLSACSVQTAVLSAGPAGHGGAGSRDRFARAEEYGQFIPVKRTADCKGATVTIEKILLDRTGTFMVAVVEGDLKGDMDYLSADLFDHRGRELGRSTLIQKLPGGKTLLTFAPVQSIPEYLRLEFFGGPVGYGSGKVLLDLKDIVFKTVDKKYTREYQLAETVEKAGYRLVVDTITAGISETRIHYKLNTLGDYDGIRHGWFYDWLNNYSPEGEVLSLSDSGRKLGLHLSSNNCLGPYYRISQDKRTMVGRANFDPLETSSLRVSLTNMYGFYNINEIIPIGGVKEKLDINKKVPVRGYTVELKSFAREDGESWTLDYNVLDSAGNKVDAAINAFIYGNVNHRAPLTMFSRFKDISGGDRRIILRWQPPEDSVSPELDPVIKIFRLGIRLEDTVLDIDLKNPKKPGENRDEARIMAAVNEYFDTLGSALVKDEIAVMEDKYGYLKPTGKEWDGVNDWRRRFNMWRLHGVKDYSVSFTDLIVTVNEDTATADIQGFEKILRSGGDSAAGFSTVFYLEKQLGEWKITKVDDFTEAEMHGVN